jgi:hypothetical protein
MLGVNGVNGIIGINDIGTTGYIDPIVKTINNTNIVVCI